MAAKLIPGTSKDLPTRFFVYGSTRDDDDSGNAWTAKFVNGCIKAYDAKIYGHKIYKRIDQNFPFSIKTNNDKDFVVGRVLEFEKDLFDKKLAHGDHINGYDPNRNENENYYQRVVVYAYLQNDSTKITQKVKAISYVQNAGTTLLSKCIAIPFNDWMKRHALNNKNDGKKMHKIKQKHKILKYKNKNKNKETNDKINDEIKANDNDNDVAINGEEICKLKFKNWLCNALEMNQYLQLFIDNDCDSIKFIQFLDETMLKDTIGIKNAIHIQYILKEIKLLKKNEIEFEKYLDNNEELKQYKQALKQMGIFTLTDLHNDFTGVNDLKMLKIKNDDEASDLWNIIHPQEGM